MTRRSIPFLFFVLLTTVAWLACTQQKDPCITPTVAALVMGTYLPADTGTAGKAYELPAVRVGLVDTNIWFKNGFKGQQFGVFLSPLADSCRFFIQPDTNDHNTIDTVVLYYQRNLHFVSGACGYTYFYSLKNARTTNNSIDSVRIEKTEVTTDANIEHVKIFY